MKCGFYIKRQKGSHIVLKRDSPYSLVIVPAHKSIDTGTLDEIIESAGLALQQFVDML
ncbi:MAG: type II toxin-antitoxin system HicA family toxin [Candidatus Hydrogenedentota bacterium]